MAVPHAQSGDVIEIGPLGIQLSDARTHTLVKTDHLEVLRMVLPAGKKIGEHKAPGEITVQCLEGQVHFTAPNGTRSLHAGQMLFLHPGELHALEAVQDSSLLVTMLLHQQTK